MTAVALTKLRLDVRRGADRPGSSRTTTRRARVFNGVFDKRPALIARCTSAADVQIALAHARSMTWSVAVRGGGHSIPGHSSCDGGLVIDTGPMKHSRSTPSPAAGRFGAGLTWAEFDAATQAHGLAVTGGRVSHTGIAGLTLGSGSGWLERVCGTTCENLLSAEVVTADGRVLRASAAGEPRLFWGLKGGGGNFGVVTEFEFRLHPIGPLVYAGMILHPRAAAPELLRFYRDFMDAAPDEVCGGVALLTAPPADPIPEPARGQPAAGLIVLYAGDPHEGEEILRPLLEWGEPWLTMVQPMPYTAVQAMSDDANPWGISEYFKIDYLPELPDDAIDALVTKAADARSPFTGVFLARLGGALARTDRTAMALKSRTPSGSTSARRCGGTRPPPKPRSPGPTPSRKRCGPGASTRHPPTSSPPTRDKRGCAPPTATRSTSDWSPSRTPTTPTTSSRSTRTSTPTPART